MTSHPSKSRPPTTLQETVSSRPGRDTNRGTRKTRGGSLLRVHDLGIDARRKINRPTTRTIAAWRARKNDTLVLATARAEATRLASRILALDTELDANERSLKEVVHAAASTLLDLPGLGPVTAAIVLTAWSHPGRVRDEAGFAKLGGVCPLEVSSGRRQEHRLNRTGDRQLNRALHTIANSRIRHDTRTRNYVARRTTTGLTKPRIRRCLKRYIARELHRHLAAAGFDNP
ncbi:transposase [Microlunatus speluncae]|uniref:transposase n=1 Tax=Microlunatus speluncae TaxID=2594267 RepID=UPI00126682A0|nr:transposase [Microlunatus speluncae]